MPWKLRSVPQLSGPQEWLGLQCSALRTLSRAMPPPLTPGGTGSLWHRIPSRLTGGTPPSNPTTTMAAEGLPSHVQHDTTTPHPQSKAAGQISPTTPALDGQTLLGLCPWLSSVPHSSWNAMERFTWTTQPTAVLQGRDILLLYTGPRDGEALDDIFTQQQQDLSLL